MEPRPKHISEAASLPGKNDGEKGGGHHRRVIKRDISHVGRPDDDPDRDRVRKRTGSRRPARFSGKEPASNIESQHQTEEQPVTAGELPRVRRARVKRAPAEAASGARTDQGDLGVETGHPGEISTVTDTPGTIGKVKVRPAEKGTKPKGKKPTEWDAFEKRHPGVNVWLTILYAPHGSYEDMKVLEQVMNPVDEREKPDAYFYENADGNVDDGPFQKLADVDPSECPVDIEYVVENSTADGKSIKGSALEAQYRALFPSKGVVIGHMDRRPGDPGSSDELKTPEIKDYATDDYNQTLDNLAAAAQSNAGAHNGRESNMPYRFEAELERLFIAHPELTYPELRGKTELDVLQTMGNAHSYSLDRKFRARGIPVRRSYSGNPHIYTYMMQTIRQYSSGKEPPGREVLAKAHFERILEKLWMSDGSITNTSQMARYARYVTSQIETPKIEQYHKAYMDGTLDDFKLEDILFKINNGPMPHTKEELEAVVEKLDREERPHPVLRTQEEIEAYVSHVEGLPEDQRSEKERRLAAIYKKRLAITSEGTKSTT